jgi:two-component system, response regulator
MNYSRSILLVEDKARDEKLAIRALAKNQITNEVIVVRDGEEALDFLFGTGAYQGRDSKELPAVVLLDLKLPKLDGLEVLSRIRNNENTKRLPVVILTSSDEENDLIKSYDNGANSYIKKPVDFEHFVEVVNKLGFYWLLMNSPAPK